MVLAIEGNSSLSESGGNEREDQYHARRRKKIEKPVRVPRLT